MTDRLARPRTLVGARVPRVNDAKLLTGVGRFVDDLRPPDTVHAAVIRSPVAHGRIRALDAGPALRAPGVLDVITPRIAAEATRPLACVWVMPGQRLERYPVVPEVTRYVGEPLGLVVATSRAAAEDALESIRLDVEELPVVADAEAALADGAPLLYPDWGTNVAVEMERGDDAETIEAAIARAHNTVAMRFRIQRLAGNPLETRGVLARFDPATGELTVWASTQVPHHVRDSLADSLDLPHGRVRVIAPDVGGGFGLKDHLYPDEALVCLAAIRLRRPVKWIEDRHEALLGAVHARDQVHDARLAFDADGRFVAIHSRIVANLGAHPSNVGAGPAFVASGMLPGPYRFEAAATAVRAVVSNRAPVGAYRGFGMQQATWVRERLVDEAARKLGMDPLELRRRNTLRSEELPYRTRTLQRYDSGDYVAALDRAAELIRRGGESPRDGRRRGIGLASYVEFTGLGPTDVQRIVGFRLGGYETAVVRMDRDGTVTVAAGVCPQGQGLETSLAQVAADELGVPLEDVRIVMGDTATAPYSSAGTIASRSMAVGGAAVKRASATVRGKVERIAAHMLEAAPDDIEIVGRAARVRGVPQAEIPLREIAERAWLGWDLPDGVPAGLEETDRHDPADISYSYATHAAAVAVDTETGELQIERYVVVHDCGTIVNPMIVEGQIHGGVAQGIGGALSEEVVYDASGRPSTATFLDYLMPTSPDIPDMTVEHSEVPSPFIPGGMKGMGEGGTIAPAAAIGNALANAVPEIADSVTETPLTPPRVWEWLREGDAQE